MSEGQNASENFGPKTELGGDAVKAAAAKRLPAPFVPAWIYAYRLTSAEFAVLMVLWSRTKGGDRTCFPGVRLIADDCRLHPDSVFKCLARLEAMGLLTRQPTGRSNKYFLHVPAPGQVPPFSRKNPRNTPNTKGDQIPKVRGIRYPKNKGDEPKETKGDEGNPCKVHQVQGADRPLDLMHGKVARGAQKAAAEAAPSAPSPAEVKDEHPGVWDRDGDGQPARPKPAGWLSYSFLGFREWHDLTPAEQASEWRRRDPSHPAASWDGWLAHCRAHSAAALSPQGGGKESFSAAA